VTPPAAERPPPPHVRHLALAERGKLAAVKGDHGTALEFYRAALRMAQALAAPAPFARHYTDCILESLERSGQLRPALELCAAACTEMAGIERPGPLQRRDHATMLLRSAILLLRLDRGAEADLLLADAVAMARPGRLPLAEELQGWRARAFAIPPDRLTEAQLRHGYYSVRADALRPDIARIAPDRAPRHLHEQETRHGEI
jgi:hypothetical protein